MDGLDVGLLRPGVARAREHVDRAGGCRGVVRLVPVDARDAALSSRDRANRQRASVVAERERDAELIAVTELSVVPASPVFEALTYACCVHVVPVRVNTYTAPACGIDSSSLIAIDAGRLARFPYAETAIVLPSALSTTAWPNSALICGLERLDVGLLRPGCAIPHEYVHRARCRKPRRPVCR